MPQTPAIFGPQALIFDTGPLWELVLYSAVHNLHFESLKGQLLHLQNESSYKSLASFIASFAKKTTTPHVVAEISGRIIRMVPRGQPDIWRLVYDEFSAMGMDEGVRKLLEMPQRLVASVGAVDASVVELGVNHGHPSPVVISIDFGLITKCREAGLAAKHLWEVIAEGNP
jgi:hypothetical protein